MVNRTLKLILPPQTKKGIRSFYKPIQELRYRSFLKHLGTNKHGILVLATITKSGTHYMRFLIANYLKQLAGTTNNPVTATEIDEMFPNGWHHAYVGKRPYKKPTELLGLLNLHDMPRSHIEFQHPFWDNGRVLHMYRNPLDFAVSLYFYKYEYHKHLKGTMAGPVNVLDRHLEDYKKMYLSFRNAAIKGNASLLSLSYEDLIRAPEVCLSTIVRWLGFEPNPSKISNSIKNASIHTTSVVGAGEIWQRNGTAPVNPQLIKEFTDKLVSEGSVGQWKHYFTNTDLKKVESSLKSSGINLYDFILESN